MTLHTLDTECPVKYSTSQANYITAKEWQHMWKLQSYITPLKNINHEVLFALQTNSDKGFSIEKMYGKTSRGGVC
jgi:hypothetical protein